MVKLSVKIFGAGSIGNHLAQASRRMGWEVTIVDPDPQALRRTREEIYPSRYGAWDEQIRLCSPEQAPRSGFDFIIIGTPPDVHVPLARQALKEKPRVLLIEKPLGTPDLAGLAELEAEAKAAGTMVFVGYDHALAPSTDKVAEIVKSGRLGTPLTWDVEFREFWGGIFKAHPWLEGPWQTYLGYSARGGGAGGEHSHALHLFQYFAHICGAGKISSLCASVTYKQQREARYDDVFAVHAHFADGRAGRVVQDVVTAPVKKWGFIQCEQGRVEWHANGHPEGDLVRLLPAQGQPEEIVFPKKRPDDFYREMLHIAQCLENGSNADSPTRLEAGLDTMLHIHAAYRSAETGRVMKIDYAKGYLPEAVG